MIRGDQSIRYLPEAEPRRVEGFAASLKLGERIHSALDLMTKLLKAFSPLRPLRIDRIRALTLLPGTRRSFERPARALTAIVAFIASILHLCLKWMLVSVGGFMATWTRIAHQAERSDIVVGTSGASEASRVRYFTSLIDWNGKGQVAFAA